MHPTVTLALAAATLLVAPGARGQQANEMTFFVTSTNPGQGANLGGLTGADAYCRSLALAVGAGNHTWRAYLSTSGLGGAQAVNARDRIGRGPWRNAKGEVIAQDLSSLHGDGNRLSKQTVLTEKGEAINGRGDSPNNHDILTGSQPDGSAFAGEQDRTCGNWTLGGAEGSAIVGHHDRLGLQDDAPAKSWNSSHATRGCSLPGLRTTGGAGLFYCFAAD
jgi:hypothetical protein